LRIGWTKQPELIFYAPFHGNGDAAGTRKSEVKDTKSNNRNTNNLTPKPILKKQHLKVRAKDLTLDYFQKEPLRRCLSDSSLLAVGMYTLKQSPDLNALKPLKEIVTQLFESDILQSCPGSLESVHSPDRHIHFSPVNMNFGPTPLYHDVKERELVKKLSLDSMSTNNNHHDHATYKRIASFPSDASQTQSYSYTPGETFEKRIHAPGTIIMDGEPVPFVGPISTSAPSSSQDWEYIPSKTPKDKDPLEAYLQSSEEDDIPFSIEDVGFTAEDYAPRPKEEHHVNPYNLYDSLVEYRRRNYYVNRFQKKSVLDAHGTTLGRTSPIRDILPRNDEMSQYTNLPNIRHVAKSPEGSDSESMSDEDLSSSSDSSEEESPQEIAERSSISSVRTSITLCSEDPPMYTPEGDETNFWGDIILRPTTRYGEDLKTKNKFSLEINDKYDELYKKIHRENVTEEERKEFNDLIESMDDDAILERKRRDIVKFFEKDYDDGKRAVYSEVYDDTFFGNLRENINTTIEVVGAIKDSFFNFWKLGVQ
jgi:hypothetical protein